MSKNSKVSNYANISENGYNKVSGNPNDYGYASTGNATVNNYANVKGYENKKEDVMMMSENFTYEELKEISKLGKIVYIVDKNNNVLKCVVDEITKTTKEAAKGVEITDLEIELKIINSTNDNLGYDALEIGIYTKKDLYVIFDKKEEAIEYVKEKISKLV